MDSSCNVATPATEPHPATPALHICHTSMPPCGRACCAPQARPPRDVHTTHKRSTAQRSANALSERSTPSRMPHPPPCLLHAPMRVAAGHGCPSGGRLPRPMRAVACTPPHAMWAVA
uniref:Uncharacterized protein n=1 Tax=Chlamydomonas euryale TaxID=1486919 RepID=A0A7R9V500_9CHLO